jgi:hypothetical protein
LWAISSLNRARLKHHLALVLVFVLAPLLRMLGLGTFLAGQPHAIHLIPLTNDN